MEVSLNINGLKITIGISSLGRDHKIIPELWCLNIIAYFLGTEAV